jgi:DNA polymerase IV
MPFNQQVKKPSLTFWWSCNLVLLCVVIPYFVVALERERDPELATAPLVVYEVKGNKRAVYAFCPEAKRAGMVIGMSRSRVRALCPGAQERDVELNRYARAAHDQTTALLDLTDRLEWEQKASLTLWLDMGKASPSEMKTAVEALNSRIKQPFQVGIAKGLILSRIAALTTPPNKARTITPGQEQRLLASMRLDQFAIAERFREQCRQFGLHTLTDLGRLPESAVAKRFGEDGWQLYRLYHGHDPRQTLNRCVVPLREELAHPFDTPISDHGIAERVLQHMAGQLSARLRERGLACEELSLTVHCENHTLLEASRLLAKGIQGQKAIASELIRLLDRVEVASGMDSFIVQCDRLAPSVSEQLDFFGTLFGSPKPAIEQVVRYLAPRHPETPLYKVTVEPLSAYLPERNIILQSVTAA